MTIFSIKDISFEYGNPGNNGTKALRVDGQVDISGRGMTAIVGPSGAGKSTLLNILSGFSTPDVEPDGHLLFNGDDFHGSMHNPGDVAFVLQSPTLLGAANGFVNVIQGAVAARREGCPGIDDLLRDFGIVKRDKEEDSFLANRASDLSGGQARRLAVLRALLTQSKVVLCDEPTASLDEMNAGRVLDVLKNYTRDRLPVVWVTHKLSLAAQHADHFLFVVGNRVYAMDAAQEAAFLSQPAEWRAQCLRYILSNSKANSQRIARIRELQSKMATLQVDPTGPHSQGPAASSSGPVETHKNGRYPLPVGRLQYARWVASALSTDSSMAEWLERGQHSSLASRSQLSHLRRLDPHFRAPFTAVGRFLRKQLGYSRPSLILVLFVLTGLMFLGWLLGDLARAYSDERLQDPSVARVVFEHVVGRPGSDHEPDPLYISTLDRIQAELRQRLETTESTFDAERVLTFGRRTVRASMLRFPEAGVEHCREWVRFETVALSVEDPLIRQTTLVQDAPGLIASIPEVLDMAVMTSADSTMAEDRPTVPIVVLDGRVVEELSERCGVQADIPIRAEWAPGLAFRRDPIPVRVGAAFSRPPPLYPVAAELLVFEHDYQAAAFRGDGAPPDPFRIATLYFPIDAFDDARQLVEEEGYAIRDDSAAAVQALQSISRLAGTVPLALAVAIAVCCALIAAMAISAIIEPNKRVLALFTAHGFGFRDLLVVLFLHLAPAVIYAFLLTLAFVGFVWLQYGGLVREFTSFALVLRTLLYPTAVLAALALLVATLVVATIWWYRNKNRLVEFLRG